MTLDTIVDNLRDGVKRLQPGTFQNVDELRAAQITNSSLRNNWYHVANANGYRVQGVEVQWALVRGNDSPILSNIDAAYDQLAQTGNFRPSRDISDTAFSAKDTLVTPLSQLRYRKDKSEEKWVYLEVRTADGFVNTGDKFEAPNDTEAKVFKETGLTTEYLAELTKAGKVTTRTYFLNPDYVRQEIAKDPEGKPIWRASRLGNFLSDSGFNAGGHGVGDRGALRGVPIVAAGDASENSAVPSFPSAPPKITPARCYDTLLADEKNALAALDDTRVAGLSRLVTEYLTARVQKSS